MVKEISKKSYVWGHVGVIIYHVITGGSIIFLTYYKKLKLNERSRKFYIALIAGLLILLALLSLIPVLKDYDKIEIE